MKVPRPTGVRSVSATAGVEIRAAGTARVAVRDPGSHTLHSGPEIGYMSR